MYSLCACVCTVARTVLPRVEEEEERPERRRRTSSTEGECVSVARVEEEVEAAPVRSSAKRLEESERLLLLSLFSRPFG